MDAKIKNGWIWVLGAIAVVLVIFLAVQNSSQNTVVAPANQGTTTIVPSDTTTEPAGTEDTSAGSVSVSSSGVVATTLSYDQALNKYANQRIQFDTGCQATPNAEVYINNTVVMLDNRSPDSRLLHMGGLGNTTVKAWGFKLFKISSAKLPMTFAIDCGNYQNVATITIDK